MSKPSVIIIGAGLGGLSTGTYAQMNGYQCKIFEHGRHPGGVAAEWKRQGYTIDGGIHFYMGFRPGGPKPDKKTNDLAPKKRNPAWFEEITRRHPSRPHFGRT